jgi:hypothetical protein
VEKEPKWDALKSERLKKLRGVSFEEILKAEIVGVEDHPNRDRQKVFFFKYKNKIWVVPFVESEKEIFLKTLYPSRKYTKIYQRGEL